MSAGATLALLLRIKWQFMLRKNNRDESMIHKSWQKVLKDTWVKLEKGDYDWAHLANAYWPERVREKCKTDKSLAIAHGLEDLYVEPEATHKKTSSKKKTGGEI